MAALRSTILACSRGRIFKNCKSGSPKILTYVNDIGLSVSDIFLTKQVLRRPLTNSSLHSTKPCQFLTVSKWSDIQKPNTWLSDFVTRKSPFCSQVQRFSSQGKSKKGTTPVTEPAKESPAESEQATSVFQRFKATYREHGKILIVVHVVTSAVWFGSFYMAAASGIDIVPLMESLGFSETLIKPFRSGGLGFVALAYLMYKLATPARYTVTLGGTNMTIRYFRRVGRMEPVPRSERIRELYKDGKSELRDRHFAFHQRRAKIRKQRIARNNQ